MEVRVAIIGNVDSGKSTMVGVLTRSMLDDGRGLARSKVFKHGHEEATGRTSSIGQHNLCVSSASWNTQPNTRLFHRLVDRHLAFPWSVDLVACSRIPCSAVSLFPSKGEKQLVELSIKVVCPGRSLRSKLVRFECS